MFHAVLSPFAKKCEQFFGVEIVHFLRGEILLCREIAKTLKILRQQFSGGGHSGGVPGRPAAADPGADLPGGGGTRRRPVAAELGRVSGTVSAAGGVPGPETG
jgi:hypothetical protein